MKDFKSKWTCEPGTLTALLGWSTCECGPSHHAAESRWHHPYESSTLFLSNEWQKQSPLGCPGSREQPGSCWLHSLAKLWDRASHSCWTASKLTHNMNNPRIFGNKNKSENVRAKLSMPPAFPTPLPPRNNCHANFLENKVTLSKLLFVVF